MGKITHLTFITGNAGKAAQLAQHFDFPVTHQKIDLVEVQSLDIYEIVEHKVKEAYKVVNAPVLVEDVSLTFHAMGRLPGPLIKWFLKELGNEGLTKLVDSYGNRHATAQVLFGFYDGEQVHFFDGLVEGSIASQPSGEAGFGWDTIFIPNGYKKTWAEMNDEEQKETSMRRIALKRLKEWIQR